MTARVWLWVGFSFGIFACSSSSQPSTGSSVQGLGEPCTLSAETNPSATGAKVGEVMVEDTTRKGVFCLANHFQGRESCPFGQSATELALPDSDPARCHTPDGQAVTPPIEPQLASRRAERTVYLSCRCDGPDANASYCKCGSGFSCTHLIDDLGLGSKEYSGSYCVLDGTVYDPGADPGPTCDRSAAPGSAAYCGQ